MNAIKELGTVLKNGAPLFPIQVSHQEQRPLLVLLGHRASCDPVAIVLKLPHSSALSHLPVLSPNWWDYNVNLLFMHQSLKKKPASAP